MALHNAASSTQIHAEKLRMARSGWRIRYTYICCIFYYATIIKYRTYEKLHGVAERYQWNPLDPLQSFNTQSSQENYKRIHDRYAFIYNLKNRHTWMSAKWAWHTLVSEAPWNRCKLSVRSSRLNALTAPFSSPLITHAANRTPNSHEGEPAAAMLQLEEGANWRNWRNRGRKWLWGDRWTNSGHEASLKIGNRGETDEKQIGNSQPNRKQWSRSKGGWQITPRYTNGVKWTGVSHPQPTAEDIKIRSISYWVWTAR